MDNIQVKYTWIFCFTVNYRPLKVRDTSQKHAGV